MAKKVQLVLTENVNKLGKHGDVVDVAPGYARNYLIPQKKAVVATPNVLRQVEKLREREVKRQLDLKQQAETIKTAIEKVGMFVVRKQVGEQDAIFGSVTAVEVAEAIKEVTGQEVDRREMDLPEIRKTGIYRAEIKLHSEVIASIQVEVVPTA
jgi:large subunit ribosomal protein L9